MYFATKQQLLVGVEWEGRMEGLWLYGPIHLHFCMVCPILAGISPRWGGGGGGGGGGGSPSSLPHNVNCNTTPSPQDRLNPDLLHAYTDS